MNHEAIVRQILEKDFGEVPTAVSRMTTGNANEVYLANLPSRPVIIRLNVDPAALLGSEKYIPLFRSKGIQVPDILASDYSKTFVPFAYQIQSKLEGKDLGDVIASLSHDELKGVAKEIASITKKLSDIPPINGKYGWFGADEKNVYDSWWDLLQPRKIIERNQETGVVGEKYIEAIHRVLNKYRSYFDTVPPIFYYDDMSSKNVLVHEGKFSGIVDLDTIAQGDPLEGIGRIEASWFGTEYGVTYTNAVEDALDLNDQQREMVTVYGLLNRVYWLSENGIQFNQNTSSEVDWEKAEQDKVVIDDILSKMEV
jgi:aminoglycoside phosphotransferase (APT) family kinase protein